MKCESNLWPALRQYWHPLVFSAALTDKPVAVRLLDERLVLFRISGRPACFKDLCIHRGTPLSLGRLEGEMVVCAYHGWGYNAEGACARIPALPPDRTIPRKARLEAYRCAERYGIIWACLEGPKADIPELPEFGDPRFTSFIIGPYTWQCSAARAVENFVDQAHFPWVHEGILGSRDHPFTAEFDIERRGEELRYAFDDLPNPIHPARHRRTYRLHRPFTIYLRKVRSGSQDVEVLYFTITPHSAKESTNFLYVMRNYALTPEEERGRVDLSELIAEQDRVIVESQRPEELPLDLSEELHVRGPDSVAIEYRQFMAELGVQ